MTPGVRNEDNKARIYAVSRCDLSYHSHPNCIIILYIQNILINHEYHGFCIRWLLRIPCTPINTRKKVQNWVSKGYFTFSSYAFNLVISLILLILLILSFYTFKISTMNTIVFILDGYSKYLAHASIPVKKIKRLLFFL